MNKTKRIENTFDVVRILIAILLAYLIALIILALISDDPWNVISLFIIGPFNSKKHVGDIFTLMIPLVFTGLCMCFVYAINKFNLAGEGAVNLGGCLAACVAIAPLFQDGSQSSSASSLARLPACFRLPSRRSRIRFSTRMSASSP